MNRGARSLSGPIRNFHARSRSFMIRFQPERHTLKYGLFYSLALASKKSWKSTNGMLASLPLVQSYQNSIVSYRSWHIRFTRTNIYVYTYFKKGCFSDACFIDRSASCLLNLWLLFFSYYRACSPKIRPNVYF